MVEEYTTSLIKDKRAGLQSLLMVALASRNSVDFRYIEVWLDSLSAGPADEQTPL